MMISLRKNNFITPQLTYNKLKSIEEESIRLENDDAMDAYNELESIFKPLGENKPKLSGLKSNFRQVSSFLLLMTPLVLVSAWYNLMQKSFFLDNNIISTIAIAIIGIVISLLYASLFIAISFWVGVKLSDSKSQVIKSIYLWPFKYNQGEIKAFQVFVRANKIALFFFNELTMLLNNSNRVSAFRYQYNKENYLNRRNDLIESGIDYDELKKYAESVTPKEAKNKNEAVEAEDIYSIYKVCIKNLDLTHSNVSELIRRIRSSKVATDHAKSKSNDTIRGYIYKLRDEFLKN